MSPSFLDATTWTGSRAAGRWAILLTVSVVTSLFVLRGALGGPFVSDDWGNVVANPWIHELTVQNLLVILDPFGEAALYTANYAPVHLLAHAVEWAFFGDAASGYHWVNAVLHGGVAVLLAAVFLDRGLPVGAALAGAAIFLVHPANIEAVAWVFQLKTVLALGFALVALLLFRRHPAWATLAFVFALLCKAQALFALPVAAAYVWTAPAGEEARGNVRWLLFWGALALLYAWPQFFAFERLGETALRPDEPPLDAVRSAISIGGRYLVLASTSWGASAFHEPARVDRWSDPWLLAALLFGAVLGGRLLYTLALRRAEAVWWLWAAAAFAPVSQIFEFLYPMADRYLYLVLPGLIGGVLTLWCAGGRLERGPWRTVSMVATLVVVLGFGVHASARARIWHSNLALMRDAARHYPAGIAAHHMRARDAAVAGDVAGTVRELRGALERGWDYFPDLQTDAVYLPLRTHPDFLALEQDVVKEWLEKEVRRPRPTQASVYRRAQAYVMLGDLERAVEAYEQAIEFGGPWTASLAEEVGPLRARLRAEQRRSARE